MPLLLTTLSLYLRLRKPCRLLSLPCGLPQLIWHEDTFNWQWMRLTSIKQHSVQACLASMSLLTCHSDCLMWEQSFRHLVEMCLGDQQYLTLLFCLDDICIFSSSVDEMLNWIEMVLKHPQDFNLKIKPKKSFSFNQRYSF